jgi:hypothetical protein
MAKIGRRGCLGALAAMASGATLGRVAQAAAKPVTLREGGGEIDVHFESSEYGLPETALVDWVRQAAHAVSTYYRRYPVPRADIRIFDGGRRGISGGTSYGEPNAWSRISVGRATTVEDLNDDWMLTHEMVHFGFPSVARRHHWVEEGIAVYVEPIARVQAGTLSVGQMWSEVARDMPQGLPEDGDEGLDYTHTWGRTYWGGALFCLVADLNIRKASRNTKGLQDALRAINRAGGTIEADWPLERAWQVGDQATGGHALSELYAQMRAKPVMVDLPDLWRQLGIRREGRGVVFDDRAPLAHVRSAITRGSKATARTEVSAAHWSTGSVK